MKRFALVLATACDSGAKTAPTPPPPPPVAADAASDGHIAEPELAVVPPTITGGPVCGFKTFEEFDRETWRVASSYTYKVDRAPGDRRMLPDGKLPPLGPPPKVGTCRVHAVDPMDARYQIKSGTTVVADITLEGPILRTPAFVVDGFTVGAPAMKLVEQFHPAVYKTECSDADREWRCTFARPGEQPTVAYYFRAATLGKGNLIGIQPLISGPDGSRSF